MLRIQSEWLGAAGVKHPVLAATWARLEILASTNDKWRSLTSCENSSSGAVQSGVDGALFPLANWLVRNWWFLLHESPRSSVLPDARDDVLRPEDRHWIQRHNLLLAREGSSLPDVTIYRDGPWIRLRCVPDPFEGAVGRPVRFTTDHEFGVPFEHFEAELDAFVNRVLGRLESLDGTRSHVETLRFRSEWEAVLSSRNKEPALCGRLAKLGVDPYGDSDELPDELVQLLESEQDKIASELLDDLACASSARNASRDLDAVRTVAAEQDIVLNTSSSGGRDEDYSTAYKLGRAVAQQVRTEYGLKMEPIADLDVVASSRLGLPSDYRVASDTLKRDRLLSVAGWNHRNQFRLVEVGHPVETSRRFQLARGLFFMSRGRGTRTPRLVTKGDDWDQKASRAFAAELLAPADALRDRVSEVVSEERLAELAQEFRVSEFVIRHQMKNNRIAQVEQW